MLALVLCAFAQDVTVTARETPTVTSIGSGVVVARHGTIYTALTAAHVVRNKTDVKVRYADREFSADVVAVAYDVNADVGVLRLRSSAPLKTAKLSAAAVNGGDLLNLGTALNSNTVRTKTLVVSGDSGSAVYRRGEVVGIVSGTYSHQPGTCWFTPADRIQNLLK